MLKTWMVPLSLEAANHLESGEKAKQWMSALSKPLLSCKKDIWTLHLGGFIIMD